MNNKVKSQTINTNARPAQLKAGPLVVWVIACLVSLAGCQCLEARRSTGVDFSERGLRLNGEELDLPVSRETLIRHFGKPITLSSSSPIWDGIRGHDSNDGIDTITLVINECPYERWCPKGIYTGAVAVNGRQITSTTTREQLLAIGAAAPNRFSLADYVVTGTSVNVKFILMNSVGRDGDWRVAYLQFDTVDTN